jgi:hypothetical protein
MSVSNRSVRQFSCLRPIIGVLLAVLAALSLAGCSTVRLSYNNAPELVYWWLDSYLDFNDAQSHRVRADLKSLQSWHRQHELPLYLGTLQKLQGLAPADVSPVQLCLLFDEQRPRLQAVLDKAEPGLLAVAPTLTAAQLEHLARQFDKKNKKWRTEWLSDAAPERKARRVKQLVDRAELFYGRLEPAQTSALHASVAESVFDANLSQREFLRRQQDTLQTLRKLQGKSGNSLSVSTELHALLARSTHSPEPDYLIYAGQMMQDDCRTFAALHNSATPSQRRHLLDTLNGYAADVRALMAALH